MDGLELINSLAVVAIPAATPVIIDLMRKVATGVAKAIPVKWLPVIAPVVGMVLSVVGQAFGIPGLDGTTVVTGAALGAAGVGVREITNQHFTGKKKAAEPKAEEPKAVS